MSRRKPFNPAKQKPPEKYAEQLGVPKKERLQHSKSGFGAEQLAVGHRRHGRVRSREKSPLTHPALQADMRAARTRVLVESGKELPPEGISIPLTPSDRVTAQNSGVLWRYISARIEAETGRVRSANYEGAIKSGELHRLPFTDGQFNRRAFIEWLGKQPGWKYFTGFLDRYVEMIAPEIASDPTRIMSKAELGMWLGDCDSPRDAKNIADGGLAAICHGMAEAAAEFAAFERQKRRQLT